MIKNKNNDLEFYQYVEDNKEFVFKFKNNSTYYHLAQEEIIKAVQALENDEI